ncbi:MAG: TrkA family potassium uptake protein [Desulfarculus sp.]|jgi:trk system potassium uptake protein TrkA|nr:MAG: TrkA family potassium uptake protein [Desulfarculus sp.]
MPKSLFIVVVGCGRLGSLLANGLSRQGHNVVVVDRREEAFAELSVEFSGFKVVGDAVESETLRKARAADADCIIAAAEEDNVNLMVAQVAKEVFGVKRVIARVAEPARELAYRQLNIETVSPTSLAGDHVLMSLARDQKENPS